MRKFSEVDDMVHLSLTFRRIILVPLSLNFNKDSFVMDTQPYVRIEFGRYQRSAYFFPSTRVQPLYQCECAVEFRYNISLGILNFYPSRSYGIYEFDIAEDDSTTTLETAHDRLAHRWHWDFGIPHIAHAFHTSLESQRTILVHEHRQFKGDSSVMDTQPSDADYGSGGLDMNTVELASGRNRFRAGRKCGKEMRRSIPACRQIATGAPIIWWKKQTNMLEEPVCYKFNIAEDDSSTSPTRISNIGNGPRPSHKPLALGFWYSTHLLMHPIRVWHLRE
ncbi:hypothetical protein T07_11878 [Trichinella nelsoni]|uniref:Uncharacterized protein n=1 Tax=Trichinella nelsoni TaxID=6336 RepID=A0A0V0RM34_9BILA|nr:hypothetical protein T07_11878 [Trichinella nelsoni]